MPLKQKLLHTLQKLNAPATSQKSLPQEKYEIPPSNDTLKQSSKWVHKTPDEEAKSPSAPKTTSFRDTVGRTKYSQQAPAVQPAPVPAVKPAPVVAKPVAPAVAPAKPAVAPVKPAPAKPAAPKGKLTDQQYQEMIKNITQGLTPQQQENLKRIETNGADDPTVAPTPVPSPPKGQGVGKFDRKPQSTALPLPPAPSSKDHGKFRSGKFSQLAETLLSKSAQMAGAAQMQALQAKMDAALQPFGYVVAPGSEVRVSPETKVVDVNVKALPHAKFPQGSQTGELRKILAPLVPGMSVNTTVLF